MKNVFTLFAALLILSASAFAQSTPAQVKFKEEVHNFGKVPQGTPVTHEFAFMNDKNAPIIIENVQSTCGCTVPEWSKNPVLPGQQGKVTAQYNAAREGTFKKPITVYYSVNGEKHEIKLWLEGEVIHKDKISGAPEKTDNILKK